MDDRNDEEVNELQIEGRNPVLEAFRAGQPIDKIYVLKGAEGSLKKIVAIANEHKVVIQEVTREKLNDMSQTDSHQGVIALAAATKYFEIEDILNFAKEKNEPPFIIILDGITDPHNLGAIIRTADCAGAHGVIIPKRRAVTLNSTVSKTSAGAISYVKVAKVTNINTTLEELKQAGLWIACADTEGLEMYKTDLKGPMGLVIGGEGKGVSRLVKENCDIVVNIPMYGNISSLNASVASSLLMYEVVRQRRFTEQ